MELCCICLLTEGALVQGRCGSGVKMCCWTVVCWNSRGYMELYCVCVLTEGVLGQGRMWEWSEDVLLDSCLL